MKITLELQDDVITAIEKITSVPDSFVELEIPEGSVVFENSLNLKLLKKEAEKVGKSMEFITDDEAGQNLISMLDAPSSDFVSKTESFEKLESHKSKKKISLFKGLGNAFQLLRVPKFNIKFMLVILGLVAIVVGALYTTVFKVPKATVLIVVNSQPLTKSVEVKVVKDSANNSSERILNGLTVEATVTDSQSIETTGEKIIGSKATGKIKIINKTDTDIALSKGEQLAFKDTSLDLIFYLDDDVTIPAESPEDPLVFGSPLIPGEAEANVIASDIGNAYNLDDGESLEFEDYKKSQIEAQVSDDLKGGKSDIVNVVAKEDMQKLSSLVLKTITEESSSALDKKLADGQKRIPGSNTGIVVAEEFDKEIDEEATSLSLTQTAAVTALTYSEKDLDSLLDSLVKVPNGFVQSSKERKVNVEVLGNSDSTVLSSQEADLQVTLKAFVIPDIEENQLKEKLAGKKLNEAQKVLGSVRNVKSYELKISPNIPFLQRMPVNVENISLEITRD